MKTTLAIATGVLLGSFGVHLLAAGPTAGLVAGPLAGIAIGAWSISRQWTRITAALGLPLSFVLTLAAWGSRGGDVPVAPHAALLATVPVTEGAHASPLGSLKAVRLRH